MSGMAGRVDDSPSARDLTVAVNRAICVDANPMCRRIQVDNVLGQKAAEKRWEDGLIVGDVGDDGAGGSVDKKGACGAGWEWGSGGRSIRRGAQGERGGVGI